MRKKFLVRQKTRVCVLFGAWHTKAMCGHSSIYKYEWLCTYMWLILQFGSKFQQVVLEENKSKISGKILKQFQRIAAVNDIRKYKTGISVL